MEALKRHISEWDVSIDATGTALTNTTLTITAMSYYSFLLNEGADMYSVHSDTLRRMMAYVAEEDRQTFLAREPDEYYSTTKYD